MRLNLSRSFWACVVIYSQTHQVKKAPGQWGKCYQASVLLIKQIYKTFHWLYIVTKLPNQAYIKQLISGSSPVYCALKEIRRAIECKQSQVCIRLWSIYILNRYINCLLTHKGKLKTHGYIYSQINTFNPLFLFILSDLRKFKLYQTQMLPFTWNKLVDQGIKTSKIWPQPFLYSQGQMLNVCFSGLKSITYS